MNNESNKVHERSSEFFASKDYRDFMQELSSLELPIKNPPFTELSFKCCGYGYFPHYKQNMIRNFTQYLKDAITECKQLTTLKIIFNGFNISDGSLLKICDSIFAIGQKKKLKTLWLHTTNLRDCSEKEFITMFNIYERLGCDVVCEEINIQMADWEFIENQYPTYEKLVRIFTQFTASITNCLYFKKFKLEMSSWYMKQKDAYKFIKDTLDLAKLRQKFQSKDSNELEPQVSDALNFYLQNLDKKYMNPTYKYKITDERYNNEEKEQHDAMIKRMAQCQAIVSKNMIKYPNQLIMNLRVEEFHKNMTNFLSGLLQNLPHLQEYHIDFRNWNSMFGMANLKKNLDTKVNKKPEFSAIRRSLAMKGGIKPIEGQQIGLKTIYMM